MRFHTRSADMRPFCMWADFEEIHKTSADHFRDGVVYGTHTTFTHLTPKENAIAAMDRMRLQGLFGPTSRYEFDYAQQIQEQHTEILTDVIAAEELLEREEKTDPEFNETQELAYFHNLSWNIQTYRTTDPYQQHQHELQSTRDRIVAFAMITHRRLGTKVDLSKDLLQMILPPQPQLANVFDAD